MPNCIFSFLRFQKRKVGFTTFHQKISPGKFGFESLPRSLFSKPKGDKVELEPSKLIGFEPEAVWVWRDLNPNGFKSQPKIELWWSRPEPKPWFAS